MTEATRLTSLTEDQTAMMPLYRDRYIDMAKSTKEADWEVAEQAVKDMLRIAEIVLSQNFRIIRCRNPVLAAQAGDQLSAKDGGGRTLFQAVSCAGSAARNDFFAEVCNVTLPDHLEEARKVLTRFVGSCGGAYFHSDFVIIYDRPSVLKLRDNNGTGVLHSENTAAIAWGRGADGEYDPADKYGYAMYFFNGTRVPEAWIMDKPTTEEARRIRAQEVLGTTNQDVMAAGGELMGWLPLLEAVGMVEIDVDPDPKFGRLVSVNLPNAEDSRFLVAVCGTLRTIAVPASPDAKTAIEAGAMSYGMTVDEYRELEFRT